MNLVYYQVQYIWTCPIKGISEPEIRYERIFGVPDIDTLINFLKTNPAYQKFNSPGYSPPKIQEISVDNLPNSETITIDSEKVNKIKEMYFQLNQVYQEYNQEIQKHKSKLSHISVKENEVIQQIKEETGWLIDTKFIDYQHKAKKARLI